MNDAVQPGILAEVPRFSRYLTFALRTGVDPRSSLEELSAEAWDEHAVVGVGASTVAALGRQLEGLATFPALAGAGVDIPSTPAALWLYLRGDDRGELLHAGRRFEAKLFEAFELEAVLDGFQYSDSRDLTGYVDGTENPEGDKALNAAIVQAGPEALQGSSFVAVQKWVHDLDTFLSLEPAECDHIIGRRRSDNEELDDAPITAHVKRTAQESFDPEAFVVRRSMPWAQGTAQGLQFIAFGKSFDAYNALLRRMVGLEDGQLDALFRFSHPATGAFFWCPPLANGRLNLSAILG